MSYGGHETWEEYQRKKRETRAARRGKPPVAQRPRCQQCKKRLQPDYPNETDPAAPIRRWKGYYSVFCTMRCALEWATDQPQIRVAMAHNKALIDRFNGGSR